MFVWLISILLDKVPGAPPVIEIAICATWVSKFLIVDSDLGELFQISSWTNN